MERITIDIRSKSKKELLIKILDALKIPYKKENHPSPSGDKWFLDLRNLAHMDEGIKQGKEGEIAATITSKEDLENYFESL